VSYRSPDPALETLMISRFLYSRSFATASVGRKVGQRSEIGKSEEGSRREERAEAAGETLRANRVGCRKTSSCRRNWSKIERSSKMLLSRKNPSALCFEAREEGPLKERDEKEGTLEAHQYPSPNPPSPSPRWESPDRSDLARPIAQE